MKDHQSVVRSTSALVANGRTMLEEGAFNADTCEWATEAADALDAKDAEIAELTKAYHDALKRVVSKQREIERLKGAYSEDIAKVQAWEAELVRLRAQRDAVLRLCVGDPTNEFACMIDPRDVRRILEGGNAGGL